VLVSSISFLLPEQAVVTVYVAVLYRVMCGGDGGGCSVIFSVGDLGVRHL
jgi:hypothetical protein